MKKVDTKQRAVEVAKHIIKTGDTVRKTALVFGVSKSTIHNDVSNNLKDIDLILYLRTRNILNRNFKQKHLKGGYSTQLKYSQKTGWKPCFFVITKKQKPYFLRLFLLYFF